MPKKPEGITLRIGKMFQKILRKIVGHLKKSFWYEKISVTSSRKGILSEISKSVFSWCQKIEKSFKILNILRLQL